MPMSNNTTTDSSTLDLTGLREMTGGDIELERALFSEFLRAGEGFVQLLNASCDDAQAEQWRKTAHAFKGVAFNLGAMKLGELCTKAQSEFGANMQSKHRLLDEITKAYRNVTTQLDHMLG